MSVDRKLWNATLSALMFAQTACGVAVGRQPEATPTPVTTPAKAVDIDVVFEQANCTRAGVTVPKPLGWTVLELQITPNFINCYISKQPIIREEDFRNGLRISRLSFPFSDQERTAYAKQLASQPDTGLLPQAGTYEESRVGSFRIFQGRFTSTRNNIISDEEKKIILPDNSTIVYICAFTTPKPISSEDFRKFGKIMLDNIRVTGMPTR